MPTSTNSHQNFIISMKEEEEYKIRSLYFSCLCRGNFSISSHLTFCTNWSLTFCFSLFVFYSLCLSIKFHSIHSIYRECPEIFLILSIWLQLRAYLFGTFNAIPNCIWIWEKPKWDMWSLYIRLHYWTSKTLISVLFEIFWICYFVLVYNWFWQ